MPVVKDVVEIENELLARCPRAGLAAVGGGGGGGDEEAEENGCQLWSSSHNWWMVLVDICVTNGSVN